MPYFVGVDVSKWKHDVFIMDGLGEAIKGPFEVKNDSDGFSALLESLKPLGDKASVSICMESTGHYHKDLSGFLKLHGYIPSIVNPYLISRFAKGVTLRKEKNDRYDSIAIARYAFERKPTPSLAGSENLIKLRRLTRVRDKLVRERSDKTVIITDCLDEIFPEYAKIAKVDSALSLALLERCPTAKEISSMSVSFREKLRKVARRASSLKIQNIMDAAKKTVGRPDESLSAIIASQIPIFKAVDNSIDTIENEIKAIMAGLDEHVSSIPGIGINSAAAILGEYGGIERFPSPSKMLSFAGLEPSHYQSGQMDAHGKMVKRGSPHLRYVLMNVAVTVKNYSPIFAAYYLKKREAEGKKRRVALSHVAKKLIRVIWKLETSGCDYEEANMR